MKSTEIEASLKVLLAVAIADGVVVPDERRLLSGVAEKLGVPFTMHPISRSEVASALAAITSREAKDLTFSAAVALANVDGICSQAEHELLVQIRDALAPEKAIPLERNERYWEAKMRTARAQIDRVSDGFLDALAAQRNELSDLAYQKMVADLDRRKTELLRDAVLGDAS